MRWCVAGIGAVGSYWAGFLAKAGEDVVAIARGRQLEALNKKPLKLSLPTKEFEVKVEATDNISSIKEADVLVLAVKSHQLEAIAPALGQIISKNTIILPVMNGLPWWYFHGVKGEYAGHSLKSVDPDGVINAALPAPNVIGCVTNIATSLVDYGHADVSHEGWLRMGEPDGGMSYRLLDMVERLKNIGMEAESRSDIRADIWFKLWGNAVFNPISVLTGATMGDIANHPLVLPKVKAVMREVADVAASLGIKGLDNLEARLAISRGLGAHKTSMLQDWLNGREMEIGTLLSAVIECAEITGVAVPNLEIIEALLRQKQEVALALA